MSNPTPGGVFPHLSSTNNEIDDAEANAESTIDQEAFQEECAGLKLDDFTPPVGKDRNGNPWLVFVHTTGVHYLPVQFCCCPSSPRRHLQLLATGLYPATVRQPRTAFTFEVLNDFYLENLECKTTARNFYSKLKRRTSSIFPNLIPV